MNLPITKEDALKAFKNATPEGKKLLTDLFGAKTFYTNIKDRVKTFEDACEIVGEDARGNIKAILDYNGVSRDMISTQAFAKLTLIARALNEGWTPDWSNSSEYKYYPFFEYKSGFGFSHSDFGLWRASTACGSRLCFKSRELAEYAGKQFQAIYNDFLTL